MSSLVPQTAHNFSRNHLRGAAAPKFSRTPPSRPCAPSKHCLGGMRRRERGASAPRKWRKNPRPSGLGSCSLSTASFKNPPCVRARLQSCRKPPTYARKTTHAAKPRVNPAPATAHPPELTHRQCSPQADFSGVLFPDRSFRAFPGFRIYPWATRQK